jgi:hypothetical protein
MPALFAPAPALPPSLEELEQPTHQAGQAKPIKTLLLAENRSAGFMPGAYHAPEFPQQRGSAHRVVLGTATLLFLGVAARHWSLLPWHPARAVRAPVRRAALDQRAGIGSARERPLDDAPGGAFDALERAALRG